MISYFPNLFFGWTYLVILLALLSIASYLDFRFMKLPKWLTLTTLGVGVLANLIRGACLGYSQMQTWVLEPHGMWLGIADGFLFSLAGFLVSFFLFLGLWLLGVSGGGDVKLFAALGAWLGPLLILQVFIVTVFVVAIIVLFRLAGYLFSGQGFKAIQERNKRKGKLLKQKKRQGDLGFSLPVAIACLLVLLWAFRFDLNISSQPDTTQPSDNARVELTR